MQEIQQEIQNSPEFRAALGTALRSWSDRDKAAKVERFRRLNRFVRPGQIVFAGSSLMEQFPIHELLADLDLSYSIYNRGIGGYTTSELLKVMDVCLYDLKPRCVFLNIGTNDLNDPKFEEADFVARYEKILQGIRENLPDTTVYVLAYYPVNSEVGAAQGGMAEIFRYRTNARVRQANACVRQLADRLQLQYLDLNAGLADETGALKREYTIDGIHMYADGYRVVLGNLLPVLKQV